MTVAGPRLDAPIATANRRTEDEHARCIVEAMEFFVADARRAKVVDDVKLPSGAAKALRTYATLRKRADQEDRHAAELPDVQYVSCAEGD